MRTTKPTGLVPTSKQPTPHLPTTKPLEPGKSFAEIKATLPAPMLQTLVALENLVQSFGDDVQCKELRLYIAFKMLRSFAFVIQQRSRLLAYLHSGAAVYVP